MPATSPQESISALSDQPEAAVWHARLRRCIRDAWRPALRIALWLLRITVPISFAVLILDLSGVLAWIADWFAPLFSLLGMPGESALVFITGALLNNYAAIAVIDLLDLSHRTITILALMGLVCHNLPVEAAVQRKTGANLWLVIAIRILASILGALALSALLPLESAPETTTRALADRAFWPELLSWLISIGHLCLKVILLVIALMILQRILEEFGVSRWLTRWLRGPLIVLGLPPRTAFLWIVANTLGLAYGAGIIIDHVERGRLTQREANLLNGHIAVCHSLLEDTLLFVAIGVPAFWITVPRILLAAIIVWCMRLVFAIRTRVPQGSPDFTS